MSITEPRIKFNLFKSVSCALLNSAKWMSNQRKTEHCILHGFKMWNTNQTGNVVAMLSDRAKKKPSKAPNVCAQKIYMQSNIAF